MGDISEINARIATAQNGLKSVITRISNDRNFMDEGLIPNYDNVYSNAENLLNASQIAICIHQMDRHLEDAIQKLYEADQALEQTMIMDGGY